MRNLRHLLSAAVLMFAMAISTSAGQIEIPRPNPSSVQSSTTAGGQIEIPPAAGVIDAPAPTSDSIIGVALNLVRGVLSLF